MDQRLVAWARAVKSRFRARPAPRIPPLWLFTDPARMNVAQAVAALPPGLCGVVFRHDGVPGRAALLRAVARLCRARRLCLVVAGTTAEMPPGAGRHLRGGRPVRARPTACVTASAHGAADLVRARRAGADCAFLSPLFPTESHPGAPALGVARWASLARGTGPRVRALPVLALGGMDGAAVRRLPRWVCGVGAISALT